MMDEGRGTTKGTWPYRFCHDKCSPHPLQCFASYNKLKSYFRTVPSIMRCSVIHGNRLCDQAPMQL
jgi:hypothetical protein